MGTRQFESVYPHVGDYFIYEGRYIVPSNFSFTVEGNSITVSQNHKFKIGEIVHSISEDFAGNSKIVLGKVSEIVDEHCLVFDGYVGRGDLTWYPEKLTVHQAFSKPAEEWEEMMYEETRENYENS